MSFEEEVKSLRDQLQKAVLEMHDKLRRAEQQANTPYECYWRDQAFQWKKKYCDLLEVSEDCSISSESVVQGPSTG